jgi:hypothetical protein
MSKLHEQVFNFSKELSSHLIPRTTAYHEIWLDKKLVAGEALKDFEPLYGEFYLPRKVCNIDRRRTSTKLLIMAIVQNCCRRSTYQRRGRLCERSWLHRHRW